VTTAQVGTAIALAVVGWPLYELVTAGDMDATTAVLRGAVVVVACIYGVSKIVAMASRFEADAETARRRRLNTLFSDMEGAVATGSLVDPDGTQPGSGARAPGAPPERPSSAS
jgi:hypothetical protein